MFIKKLVILVMVVILSGCSSTFYYPTNNSSEYFTKPDIGVEATSNLGNSIILTGNGYYADGIYVNGSGSCPAVLRWSLKIKEGFYQLVFSDATYKYYFPEDKDMIQCYHASGERYDVDFGIRIGNDNSFYVVDSSKDSFNAISIKDELNIETKKHHFISKKNAIQQTVIYTGKTDNTLKFTYREFSDDMARPAFTTDITYDLNESNIIGYKSFRAEVIEASNTEIKYRILSGF